MQFLLVPGCRGAGSLAVAHHLCPFHGTQVFPVSPAPWSGVQVSECADTDSAHTQASMGVHEVVSAAQQVFRESWDCPAPSLLGQPR